MCLKLELLFHNSCIFLDHPWPSPFSFIIHVHCTMHILDHIFCWPWNCFHFSAYIVDHLFVGGRGYIIKTFLQIDFSWFTCIVFFYQAHFMHVYTEWSVVSQSDRGFVEGMSAHPQDLSAPHMDRVQLVMSWYTDGPGGGTEWYRVVQSGTEWYSSRWWVVVIRWDPTTSPHYCQQELSNKLWTSPYLRLKRVSMILLWYP